MVTVIGSSNVDLVIQVPKIPAIGETILGGTFSQIFGGKGANQAIAAKRADGNVIFITKLGTDPHGEQLKSHFLKEEIGNPILLFDSNEKTGIAQIWVSDKGNNSIVVAPGANMRLLPEDFIPYYDEINKSSFVLMQMEIPLITISSIAEKINKQECRIILNPAPAQSLPDALWEQIWMITPNEAEASLLTGVQIRSENDALRAAEVLLNKGVRHVIITMGEKGCLWCNGNENVFFPGFKVKSVDSTAAGDVFNGALIVALDEGANIDSAIKFASAAAALSVTKLGAQSSIPFRSEIENFLRNNRF